MSETKRTRLTNEQKLNIINDLKAAVMNKEEACEKYNICRKTLWKILKDEKRIRENAASFEMRNRKSNKLPNDKMLEDAVITWFYQTRELGGPISGPILQQTALYFHEKLEAENKNRDVVALQKGKDRKFVASDGWLYGFKKRHGLNKMIPEEEILTSDTEDPVLFQEQFHATEEEEIAAIDYELRQIDAEIQKLSDHKRILTQRKEKLRDDALIKKSLSVSKKKWDTEDFSWSKKLRDTLSNVFKIKDFRNLQLPTINSIMSGEDVILIMPTGGGKSLCYQLPAMISKGITIVVSPLVSLMEDQLHGLRRLNVNGAMMLNSTASKENIKLIMDSMINPASNLRLIYITPEYMAKSKRFLAKLQKAYTMKRLDRVAIDEVHCCSQWGHDFRPDYKFLGVLKSMFPDVPILGLTATAPSKIIIDVQKMLDIQGCLVLRASFNRPNLFYEVRNKPADKEGCALLLEEILKRRFQGQSGIIYTTTIKDAEELTTDLRSRGLRVGCYHAMLEADFRSKVHAKWISGEYQAVVATIAFGLGIDKPDVRFVVHHCVSKSMENFYQESGRAGRDGKEAACIVLYRLYDIFRLSGMVFQDRVGLENLYKVIAFCLERNTCRRSLIASHFEEVWTANDCASMCDNCRQGSGEGKELDVGPYCRQLYQIMTKAVQSDTRLTALKLIDAWFGKGAVNLRVSTIPVPKFSRETGEAILGHLLVEGYLQEDFHFTAYSTISYLKRGPRSSIALDAAHKIPFKTNGNRASISMATLDKNRESNGQSSKSSKASVKTTDARANDKKTSAKSKQSSDSSKSVKGKLKNGSEPSGHSSKSKDESKPLKSERGDSKKSSGSGNRASSGNGGSSSVTKLGTSSEDPSDSAKRKIYVIESSEEDEDFDKRQKTD